MIWVFILVIGVALTFSALGAFSVWLKLMAVGLKVALFVIGILILVFAWKHIFDKKRISALPVQPASPRCAS